ncbi:MAG: hypothetical protein R2932_33595 [Caldilineaceae bacterium]
MLSEVAAQRLWRVHEPLVVIDFPSPKTDGEWQLTAQGWVGMVPVTPDLTLVLQPKVAIANLLGMVEVAYGLQSLRLLNGLVDALTIPELYDRLTELLATRVLAQVQQGLHRPYQQRAETSPYLRGRLQIERLLRQPLPGKVPCTFYEPSVDVADNQILRWTLQRALKSAFGSAATQGQVRRAHRLLQPLVTLQPFRASDCRDRIYTRLNHAYATLHALCAFFLDACGPSYLPGESASVPFVVNMARLYEEFVAAWLQTQLPPSWQLRIQERHPLGEGLHFAIDLVLYVRATGRPLAILDTKYKTPTLGPDTADIAQVVAYAAAKGVTEAILIYPQPLREPLDTVIGGVRVRTLTFALDGDLVNAGQRFLHDLALPGQPHPNLSTHLPVQLG